MIKICGAAIEEKTQGKNKDSGNAVKISGIAKRVYFAGRAWGVMSRAETAA